MGVISPRLKRILGRLCSVLLVLLLIGAWNDRVDAAGNSAVIGMTSDPLTLYDQPDGQPRFLLKEADLGDNSLKVTGSSGDDWLEVEVNGQRYWVKSDEVMVATGRGGFPLAGDPTTPPMYLAPVPGS